MLKCINGVHQFSLFLPWLTVYYSPVETASELLPAFVSMTSYLIFLWRVIARAKQEHENGYGCQQKVSEND